jgi:hypothetical protein
MEESREISHALLGQVGNARPGFPRVARLRKAGHDAVAADRFTVQPLMPRWSVGTVFGPPNLFGRARHR